MFNALYAKSAQNAGFWNPPPGNPGGPANLFDGSIYERGGMTLEALREKVGGATFFGSSATGSPSIGTGTRARGQFIDLASADSGRDLAHFLRALAVSADPAGKAPAPLRPSPAAPRLRRSVGQAEVHRRLIIPLLCVPSGSMIVATSWSRSKPTRLRRRR